MTGRFQNLGEPQMAAFDEGAKYGEEVIEIPVGRLRHIIREEIDTADSWAFGHNRLVMALAYITATAFTVFGVGVGFGLMVMVLRIAFQ